MTSLIRAYMGIDGAYYRNRRINWRKMIDQHERMLR